MITRAPSQEPGSRAWLHTVIKHEALAIRRQRERILGDDAPADPSSPRDEVQSLEGWHRAGASAPSAEALSELKPSEIQCLLLKAVGYSYDEISARTGFSWTKVNRSLSEGRKRFFERFAQLESGQAYDRYRSLLSVASDGEAAPDEEHQLKTHLRVCRLPRRAARLPHDPRSRRRAGPSSDALPVLERRLPGRVLVTRWRSGSRTEAERSAQVQQLGDAVSAQKATAVVASTAALRGGAVVHERVVDKPRPHAQEHEGSTTERYASNSGPTGLDRPASSTASQGQLGGESHLLDPASSAGEFTPEQGITVRLGRSAAAAAPEPLGIGGYAKGGSSRKSRQDCRRRSGRGVRAMTRACGSGGCARLHDPRLHRPRRALRSDDLQQRDERRPACVRRIGKRGNGGLLEAAPTHRATGQRCRHARQRGCRISVGPLLRQCLPGVSGSAGATLESVSFDVAAIRMADHAWTSACVRRQLQRRWLSLWLLCRPRRLRARTRSFVGPVTADLRPHTKFALRLVCQPCRLRHFVGGAFEMRAPLLGRERPRAGPRRDDAECRPVMGIAVRRRRLRDAQEGYSLEYDNVGVMVNRTSIDGRVVYAEDYRELGWPEWVAQLHPSPTVRRHPGAVSRITRAASPMGSTTSRSR